MWHCLVIEDDYENARYIANGLNELRHDAVVCGNGADGMRRACEEQWDIIILDRMLPGNIDGLSILSTLRALGNKTPVLVLSALSGVDERVRGLKSGGDDYLTKPFAFSELIARIEALIRRAGSDDTIKQLRVGDLTLDLISRKVERGGKLINLQPREYRLLVHMMQNAGNVVTRTMLLESVWDYRFDPQSNVIDVQISRLRRKIDTGFQTQLIHTVWGEGYVLSAQGQASGQDNAPS